METPLELQDLLNYCQQHSALTISDLREAPPAVRILISNEKLLPYILKILLQIKTIATVAQSTNVQVYADPEELKAMQVCHPRCIELLKSFTGTITNHVTIRAIDIACGSGRVSKDFLLQSYEKVDLID